MAQKTEMPRGEGEGRLDRLLWRIAPLHSGWMALPVIFLLFPNALARYLADHSPSPEEADSWELTLTILSLLLSSIFLVIYAFFVSAVTSGRFHSGRPRRLFGPRMALFVALGIPLIVFLLFVAFLAGFPLFVSFSVGQAEDVVSASVAAVIIAVLYLVVWASLDLVNAERGFGGGTGRKVGTVLLFWFWIFGAFFLQARLRRLVQSFAEGTSLSLPMEKLDLREDDSGKLVLILTESVTAEGFDTYGQELIRRLDGHILQNMDDGCWKVEIEGSNFRLLLDHKLPQILLETCHDSAELLLARLQSWLAPPAGA